jgi:Ni2+-binding GTPase involved in maturation of urease and hydrogenase
VPADPRRRLLVLNQYYWPGVEATAQLLTELCEELAQELDVEVVTGVLHGHEDEPRHLMRNGVEIVRVASTSFERSKIGARAANYVTYLSSALAAGCTVLGRTPFCA